MPGLNQVLDDLHLLLDVDLTLCRLHLQRDAEAIRRFLSAAAHVDEEGVIERLEDERHRRLVARRPAPRDCRRRRSPYEQTGREFESACQSCAASGV